MTVMVIIFHCGKVFMIYFDIYEFTTKLVIVIKKFIKQSNVQMTDQKLYSNHLDFNFELTRMKIELTRMIANSLVTSSM